MNIRRLAANVVHPIQQTPSSAGADKAVPIATRRLMLSSALLAASGWLSATAVAQPNWPTRAVRMILPFAAGGSSDLGLRLVAAQLAEVWSTSVVVENRPGGDGVVAVSEVMRSAADGHTLYFGTVSSLAYVPNVKRNPPYDPVTDLTAISGFSLFVFYLMVSSTIPAKTFGEFIEYAKAHPKEVIYGTSNSTSVVAMAQIAETNKLDMVHVQYKGEGQASIDLIGGRVHAMLATPAIMPQLLKAGFRPLVVLLPKRTVSYPDVPAMPETGQPLFEIMPWGALLGPANMPEVLVQRISGDFGEVMRRPTIVDQLDKLGMVSMPTTPAEAQRILVNQKEVWGRTMRAIGIPLE